MYCCQETVLFFLGCCLIFSKAVPVSIVTIGYDHVQVEQEQHEEEPSEAPEELILDDDDSTAHNLERLVSAATCLVAGVEYTHGQQIYRADPCEFCLCLDGEMFCWWQDCPPIAEGPCRDRRPFSPCANGSDKTNPTKQQNQISTNKIRTNVINVGSEKPKEIPTTTTVNSNKTWVTTTTMITTTSMTGENETTPNSNEENIASTESTILIQSNSNSEMTKTSSDLQTTKSPTICIVMGLEYKIGARLPHDTGNCLECVCGDGARVTCSPHLCPPADVEDDDTVDYRPPGTGDGRLRPDISNTF